MKNYIAKAVIGNMAIDIHIMSNAETAGSVQAEIIRCGGIEGPMGWVAASAILAVLYVEPQKASVTPLHVVGGKDADAREPREDGPEKIS
jgi:hypothetical protein